MYLPTKYKKTEKHLCRPSSTQYGLDCRLGRGHFCRIRCNVNTQSGQRRRFPAKQTVRNNGNAVYQAFVSRSQHSRPPAAIACVCRLTASHYPAVPRPRRPSLLPSSISQSLYSTHERRTLDFSRHSTFTRAIGSKPLR